MGTRCEAEPNLIGHATVRAAVKFGLRNDAAIRGCSDVKITGWGWHLPPNPRHFREGDDHVENRPTDTSGFGGREKPQPGIIHAGIWHNQCGPRPVTLCAKSGPEGVE